MTEAAPSPPQETGPGGCWNNLTREKGGCGWLQPHTQDREGQAGTALTQTHTLRTHTCAVCKGTNMHSDTKITIKMNPSQESCFQREVWDSHIQESEPLAEVKSPSGGDRRGSRLSIGRRRSSSTCRATSMVSSRSNSPSWSRTGSGLVERGGRQREFACLTAMSSRGAASGLLPTQTRVSWEQDQHWRDPCTPS